MAEQRVSRREVIAAAGALAGVAWTATTAFGGEPDTSPEVRHHAVPGNTTAYHPKIKEMLKKEAERTQFSWGDLKFGDCTLHHLVLTLAADGKGKFTARVSTHSPAVFGDVFALQFGGVDVNDQPLWTTRTFASVRMKDKGVPQPFEDEFYFPGYMYPYVAAVTASYAC